MTRFLGGWSKVAEKMHKIVLNDMNVEIVWSNFEKLVNFFIISIGVV